MSVVRPWCVKNNVGATKPLSRDKLPISVVIPTYNRAHCLGSAINSVITQTYKDFEIIVVDDGSTDNTKEVVQPYLSDIKYICQENKGVSAARNKGIMAAKGTWVAFLDSDDEWLPRKLELQVADLHQHPDAILSCTNVEFGGIDGATSVDYFKECLAVNFKGTQFIREPLFKSYACTSTVMARRSYIQVVGMFNEELSIYEDIDLFFRLSTLGGCVVNPNVLAKAFRRKESGLLNLSGQFLFNKEINHKSLIKIYGNLIKYDLSKIQRTIVNDKLSSSWFDLGLVYHNLGNLKGACNCFFTSFQVYPTGKNFVKLLLGLSGQHGINYIEKKRAANKGFRRSEYYENGSK